MKSKFGNISISKKNVTIISLLQDFKHKKHFFFRSGRGSNSIIWTGSRFKTGSGIKVLPQCGTELKLKVRKIWGLIPSFLEVAWEKLIGGSFTHPPFSS